MFKQIINPKVSASSATTIIAAVTLFSSTVVNGDILLTSFEEPSVVPNNYIDTLDPLTDHALLDNAGEPYVNWTPSGSEIGFSSYYFNTRDDVGLTDGDFVGVTDYAGIVGTYPDGVQGFQMSDTDGAMQTTFDEISLTTEDTILAVDVFIQETGWEITPADTIRIWAVVDGGAAEIDLLNTTGSDIDDLLIEGFWMTLNADLTGYSTFTLNLYLDSNAATEAIFVDNIRLVPAVPADFTLALNGDCNTEFTVSLTNGNAGAKCAFAWGATAGSTPVPPCPGLVVDIQKADAWRSYPNDVLLINLDANGEFAFNKAGGPAFCGKLVQVVDLDNCVTTNVAVVP